MTNRIFSLTDPDRSTLEVRTLAPPFVRANTRSTVSVGVQRPGAEVPSFAWLSPQDVTKLRAALEPFDPTAGPKPEPYGPEEFAVMALAAYVAGRANVSA